ncbi:MAG: CYTH domain-containing protein [Candidatus Aphodocola sp.]
MKKMELEVKILDINKEDFIDKIKSMGATLKKETKQFLYTYDLPTIYGRFVDIKTQLKDNESEIKYETALEKLKLLFFELDNLLTEDSKKELKEIIGCDNVSCLCLKNNLFDYLDNDKLVDFINKFHNNSKKWIRVRQTNDKTTIAVKHILADNGTGIQQMLETEVDVPSIKEANNLLEALGYSYKSYQEKERITYVLDEYELDIDTWPGIPTYVEVEGESEEDLENILGKLGYSMKDTVSCTADDIYRKYGLSMFDSREIKFENYK